jgi:hypothetical protein
VVFLYAQRSSPDQGLSRSASNVCSIFLKAAGVDQSSFRTIQSQHSRLKSKIVRKQAVNLSEVAGKSWDEMMVVCTVCIVDEKNPADLGFQAMHWKRFHEPAAIGEAKIRSRDVVALLLQNRIFEISACLPLFLVDEDSGKHYTALQVT